MRQVALHIKVQQLQGLLGTKDLTSWEQKFVQSLMDKGFSKDSTGMTDRQVETADELWEKHFS